MMKENTMVLVVSFDSRDKLKDMQQFEINYN